MPEWSRPSVSARRLLLLLALLLSGCRLTSGAPVGPRALNATFSNPVRLAESADPFVFVQGGVFYLLFTRGDRVSAYRSRTLAGLGVAAPHDLWAPQCCRVWAPELHHLTDRTGPHWFAYYTRDFGVYVRRGSAQNPLGPYGPEVPLIPFGEGVGHAAAIDPTVLVEPGGQLDLLWSNAGDIAIARMRDPTHVTMTADHAVRGTLLPARGRVFGCDIQEAPAVLARHGRYFVTFSVCGAETPDYALGLMVADAHAPLLDARSWALQPTRVFQRRDAAGVFGPGHNGFFRSPDGRQDWIVYHAKGSAARGFRDRSTRAQPFTWRADGSPDFGVPVPASSPLREPSGEVAGP